jgi:hypothetical protein
LPTPSGWVITHLIPLLCRKLSSDLRSENNGSSLVVAKRLEHVEDIVATEPAKAVNILVSALPKGVGSRKAGDIQIAVLRIIDLGILGFPVVSAIYARHLGVLDTSTVLVSESTLSIEESLLSAERLDGIKTWTISEGDKRTNFGEVIYTELLPPDNLDSIPIR